MAKEIIFFDDSEAYDRAMGRLSRIAGAEFLDWLALPDGLRWLDVGCGTGAFTELILARNAPAAISAVDPAEQQVAYARTRPEAARVDYRSADAMALPFGDDEFDVAIMALVIQYVPDSARAMSEMCRVVRPGGTVAAYVWPVQGEGHPMQILNDAVKTVLGAGLNRPGNEIRTLDALGELFAAAGLQHIESRPIDIEFAFADFDDYWTTQPAIVVRKMNEDQVGRLEAALRERLPTDETGRISFIGRANAIRGRVPAG